MERFLFLFCCCCCCCSSGEAFFFGGGGGVFDFVFADVAAALTAGLRPVN